MTDRLWNYLENEFNTTNNNYIEIKTEQDKLKKISIFRKYCK